MLPESGGNRGATSASVTFVSGPLATRPVLASIPPSQSASVISLNDHDQDDSSAHDSGSDTDKQGEY